MDRGASQATVHSVAKSQTRLSVWAQHTSRLKGLHGVSVVKNSPANVGDAGSLPGSGKSPGEGNRNPHQSSSLGNPTDRRAWRAIVHRVAKESDSTYQLSNNSKKAEEICSNAPKWEEALHTDHHSFYLLTLHLILYFILSRSIPWGRS